jgi:hypothetical protein
VQQLAACLQFTHFVCFDVGSATGAQPGAPMAINYITSTPTLEHHITIIIIEHNMMTAISPAYRSTPLPRHAYHTLDQTSQKPFIASAISAPHSTLPLYTLS